MGDNENNLPWYDYQPGVPVPSHITHLRIGVQQAMTAAAENGSAPETIELPNCVCVCHPNLEQVQIHVHTLGCIPWRGFYNCKALLQVEFVATTGQNSTARTRSNLSIQSRLTWIDTQAFSSCHQLHSVVGLEHVSSSLKSIHFQAFEYCGKLAMLDFCCLTQFQYLGMRAMLQCESLTVVDLSNSVQMETIGEGTFACCKALKIICLPPNLKRIEYDAFWQCRALESIVIPTSVEFMRYDAFAKCSGLTQVTFQSRRHLRTLMNDGQFFGCGSLHTLELQGPPISRKLWPLLLEQFLRQRNGILAQAGIKIGKQCIAIAWNFMKTNIANYYLEENKPAYRRKRDIRTPSYNG